MASPDIYQCNLFHIVIPILLAAINFPTDSPKSKHLEKLNLPVIREEYLEAKNVVENTILKVSKGVDSFSKGVSYGFGTAFCHNDLLSGNILISRDGSAEITLIDYEYASYNYVAFDIANHFCEYAGFDGDFKGKYPTQEKRLNFYKNYLKDNYSGTETSLCENLSDDVAFLEGFDYAVLQSTSLAHFLWGIW